MKTREKQRMMLAGMAMQGLLAEGNVSGSQWAEKLAEGAIKAADALLAELDRTAPKPETNNLLTVVGAYFGERFKTDIDAASYIVERLTDDSSIPNPPSPVADGWIEHRPGDDCPATGTVTVKFRNNRIDQWEADCWCWETNRQDPSCEIIAWKPA